MKISIKNLFLLTFLVVISLALHRKELNQFPKYIHAWAQSDYYALSLGFIDNEFDFYHPQNFVQNPQFPDYFHTPKDNGITAADFPIHTYSVALLMKLTGSEEPRVFRSYTLFFSIVGLFALFLLIKELNGSDVKALFVNGLILLSPVYLYYRAGFLPTIPSLSNVIIAYYFYLKYLKTNRFRFFNWSILFFTLATLSRTPFAIFLIAVFCQEVLTIIKQKKFNYRVLISFTLSFSLIIGYFMYNAFLRSKYGSLFLSKPLTPESWGEVKELIFSALENWKFHYLTKWHYLFILVASLLSVFQFIKLRAVSDLHKKLLLQFSIALFGAILYSLLMLQQFKAHDYYFLDTYFTPFILFTAFTVTYIKFNHFYLNLITFAIMAFAINGMLTHSLDEQVQRKQTGAWDKTLFTIQNYANGDELLTTLNIPRESKLLVLDSEAPNIPFILLRRYGFSVHSLTKDDIKNKLDWNYDYIVMQDNNAQDILSSIYPELGDIIERVGGNGAFSIYKKATIPKKKTIEKLLGLDKRKAFYENSIRKDINWRNKEFIADTLIKINSEEEFGLSLETYNLEQLLHKNSIIKVQLDTYNKAPFKGASLIFAISSNDKTITYQERKIIMGKTGYLFTTTPIESLDHKVSLYIWNNKKEVILVKDFSVKMY